MLTGQAVTYNARTYGRKSATKRKQSELEVSSDASKKRPKASTEPDVLTDQEEEEEPKPTPSTPQRPTASLARDLSDIFQACSPKAPPAATPTKKLARRMLARSKTESSIDSSSTTGVERTPSLPNISSISPSKQVAAQSRSPPVPVPVKLPSKSNPRTYAGQSRSFLVAIPASSLDPLAADQDDDSTRESYASLRSRWGVDNSEDDPYPTNLSPARSDSTSTPHGTPSKAKGKAKALQEALLHAQLSLPTGMMNPLKSITELRSKGESRRFLDEVGYLFEGMDSSVGIGLRRSSAMEIVTKLCDPEFARKAKAADFLSRTWDLFRDAGAGRGEDKMLDTLLAFYAALVARDPAALRELAQRPPTTPPLDTAAGCSKGDLSHRVSNLSWGTSLMDESSNEEKEKKLNESEIDKARDDWLAEALTALGVCGELDGNASAINCMQVTFRVLVSLTHSDEIWGRKIAESESAFGFILRLIAHPSDGTIMKTVKKEEEAEAELNNGKGKMKAEVGSDRTTHTMDMLCLALALLTNLVQVNEGTKNLLRDFQIDPTCHLAKRACIRGCICPHPISALDILITLYKQQDPPSNPLPIKLETESPPPEESTETETDAVFLRGHLAVLFGLLMRGSSANQTRILDALGGPERLVEHARDFAAFYDAFGGETEGRVARDVVAFLDGLRV
ncbi:hypothetical protein H0H93_006898 [Arthromyces matolae]|nr:hypothetical protein H0H93_006898 [Arthromyces matolae]